MTSNVTKVHPISALTQPSLLDGPLMPPLSLSFSLFSLSLSLSKSSPLIALNASLWTFSSLLHCKTVFKISRTSWCALLWMLTLLDVCMNFLMGICQIFKKTLWSFTTYIFSLIPWFLKVYKYIFGYASIPIIHSFLRDIIY